MVPRYSYRRSEHPVMLATELEALASRPVNRPLEGSFDSVNGFLQFYFIFLESTQKAPENPIFRIIIV